MLHSCFVRYHASRLRSLTDKPLTLFSYVNELVETQWFSLGSRGYGFDPRGVHGTNSHLPSHQHPRWYDPFDEDYCGSTEKISKLKIQTI